MGFLLFLAILGTVVSSVYAFVAIGMSGSANEPIEKLFMGLFISIPIICAVTSVYLFSLLRRNPSQPTTGKSHMRIIVALIVVLLFFAVFGRAALSAFSILFN